MDPNYPLQPVTGTGNPNYFLPQDGQSGRVGDTTSKLGTDSVSQFLGLHQSNTQSNSSGSDGFNAVQDYQAIGSNNQSSANAANTSHLPDPHSFLSAATPAVPQAPTSNFTPNHNGNNSNQGYDMMQSLTSAALGHLSPTAPQPTPISNPSTSTTAAPTHQTQSHTNESSIVGEAVPVNLGELANMPTPEVTGGDDGADGEGEDNSGGHQIPFAPSVQKCHLWNADKSKSYNIEVKPSIDRGFFIAEGNWTCYRRNYFQLSSSFTITESSAPGSSSNNVDEAKPSPKTTFYLELNGNLVQIVSFLTHISAHTNTPRQGPVELVQHTSKRDKGPLTQPVPRVSEPGPGRTIFERIQFRTATSNNGRKRGSPPNSNGGAAAAALAQQYFIVTVEVLCKVASGEFYRVCEAEMQDGVVVRGRAPGHYLNRDLAISGRPVDKEEEPVVINAATGRAVRKAAMKPPIVERDVSPLGEPDVVVRSSNGSAQPQSQYQQNQQNQHQHQQQQMQSFGAPFGNQQNMGRPMSQVQYPQQGPGPNPPQGMYPPFNGFNSGPGAPPSMYGSGMMGGPGQYNYPPQASQVPPPRPQPQYPTQNQPQQQRYPPGQMPYSQPQQGQYMSQQFNQSQGYMNTPAPSQQGFMNNQASTQPGFANQRVNQQGSYSSPSQSGFMGTPSDSQSKYMSNSSLPISSQQSFMNSPHSSQAYLNAPTSAPSQNFMNASQPGSTQNFMNNQSSFNAYQPPQTQQPSYNQSFQQQFQPNAPLPPLPTQPQGMYGSNTMQNAGFMSAQNSSSSFLPPPPQQQPPIPQIPAYNPQSSYAPPPTHSTYQQSSFPQQPQQQQYSAAPYGGYGQQPVPMPQQQQQQQPVQQQKPQQAPKQKRPLRGSSADSGESDYEFNEESDEDFRPGKEGSNKKRK
ncbi:hypothetical protein HDU79_003598 [Rhizoclosmatium sp. JEL0117]|nr:hypothetical protein HDU79_003598 [Rhizoclosmatium sp. JEL0117]